MKSQIRFGALVGGFLVLSAFSGSLFPNAQGDTRTRAITITTDAYSGTFVIDIMRDSSGATTEMSYQTPDTPNGVYTLEQLREAPQVIYNSEGHDVILISLQSDFDPLKGGHAVVRYLQNGLSGTYKDFRARLTIDKTITLETDPDANDPDSDGLTFNGPFNQVFMEKNTGFLGITLGIEDLVLSYQPESGLMALFRRLFN